MSDIAALLTWTNIRFLLEGLGLTLIISALAIACSIVLGAIISIMRLSRYTAARESGKQMAKYSTAAAT